MNPTAKELVAFVSLHWQVLVLLPLAGIAGYLTGLASPLYCARCRKIMTAEEMFAAKFRSKSE